MSNTPESLIAPIDLVPQFLEMGGSTGFCQRVLLFDRAHESWTIIMNQTNQDGTLTVSVSDRDHAQGTLDAKVLLVEYGDYHSPDCQASHHLIQTIRTEFSDCICYVFRHFPQHSQARKAAEAAEAAHAQGQFWQMHQKLCERAASIADADLIQCAIDLNLDVMQFLRDLSDHRYAAQIHDDVQSGRDSGVQGVPTFFVNGTVHRSDLKSLRSTVESLCSPQEERMSDKT